MARKQIERAVSTNLHDLDPIFKPADLDPFAGAATQVMCEIAAVTISNRSDEPLTVLAGLQLNFGDPRKVLADLQFVLGHRSTEAMKPNLLVKIEVLFGSFAFMGVTGVEDAR